MKNTFFLKNTLNNLKQTSLNKFNTKIVNKNFSLLQRQITSFNFYANPSSLENNAYNSMEDILNLSLPDLIKIDDKIFIDQEDLSTEISDLFNNTDNNKENPNIQIELKGRNSKTPKRVKYIINIISQFLILGKPRSQTMLICNEKIKKSCILQKTQSILLTKK